MIDPNSSFFSSDDVVNTAILLLGKYIHKIDSSGDESVMKIVETEAYKAPEDKACHAYNNRRTKRTETLFMAGGHWYVYLCYGIHHLLNVVTGRVDQAQAVLIRAVEPVLMPKPFDGKKAKNQWTNGPGKFTKAFGIDLNYNSKSIHSESGLFISEGEKVRMEDIVHSKRIGVDYAEEWAEKPWRFYIRDNVFVSKR